ncbi:MAG TPA: ribosome biogenesis factor YjgA [Casimicrobiaceae bacterium]
MRPIARAPRAGTVPAPETAERPSKTQRKEMMHALQDLGRELVDLDPSRLTSLDLPEQLAEAIALARKLTRHEARRRQMQYIGRLMRDVDPQPLIDALARWSGGARRGSGPRGVASRDAGSP